MGVDYTARKAAKKRRKSTIDPELESEGGKRKRKSKVRRLCQGMCYGPPALTPADAAGSDSDAGEAAAPPPQRPAYGGARAPPPGSAPAAADAADGEPPPKRKRSRKKPGAGGGALSTAVNLIEPEPDRAPAPRPPAGAAAPAAAQAAFAEWPEPIQRYMAAEGFDAPTPIQARCARRCRTSGCGPRLCTERACEAPARRPQGVAGGAGRARRAGGCRARQRQDAGLPAAGAGGAGGGRPRRAHSARGAAGAAARARAVRCCTRAPRRALFLHLRLLTYRRAALAL